MKTQTIFLRLIYEGPRVTAATRIPKSLRDRLEQRAEQAGCKLSPMIAGLLEAALDLEERLAPFQPAIERLIREDNLSAADAVARLLWMDVELNPQEVG